MTVAIVLVVALLLIVVTAMVTYRSLGDEKCLSKEKYEPPRQILTHPVDMFFNDDRYATGVERQLWGPLAPIQAKNDTHLTLRNTPWCFSTMTQYPECVERTIEAGQCRKFIPYEEDKI
jgi:hypothetical protein